jgi:hypothetical protein
MTATWRSNFTRKHEDGVEATSHRDFTADDDSDAALAAMQHARPTGESNTYTDVEKIR